MTRKKVCDPCGIPYGWAADERWLVHAAKSEHWDLAATDVVGGAHYVVARRPDADTLHARLSPDKRWIVATAVKEGRRRLYVAPFHLGTTIGAAEWFPLTDGATWEDNAQWSRDGAFVYYTSDRDGFRCIWAQRFDARAGKPSGAAFAVYHSHAARLSIKNTGSEHLGIAVAPDKLVFGLGEVRGNIWMGAVPDK